VFRYTVIGCFISFGVLNTKTKNRKKHCKSLALHLTDCNNCALWIFLIVVVNDNAFLEAKICMSNTSNEAACLKLIVKKFSSGVKKVSVCHTSMYHHKKALLMINWLGVADCRSYQTERIQASTWVDLAASCSLELLLMFKPYHTGLEYEIWISDVVESTAESKFTYFMSQVQLKIIVHSANINEISVQRHIGIIISHTFIAVCLLQTALK